MKKILYTLLLCAAVILPQGSISAQSVHRFSVKVGIDAESVDSLGGEQRVRGLVEDMFRKINRAFNHPRRFKAVYDFAVDWDAFYIYKGISSEEVHKPHPDHDYLVVIDGYKSDPKETGGGWYGADIQTVYHARTHNDRFNNPFDRGAIDGIIHEFGHARGVPDIYAMGVDAGKNPVAPVGCDKIRCIMDYPYGETWWSDYAVALIDAAGGKRVEIDNLVKAYRPKFIDIRLADREGRPVEGATLSVYPVGWYSSSVTATPVLEGIPCPGGRVRLNGDVYGDSEDYGLKYPNLFVKAVKGEMKAYAWLPLYETEMATFAGKEAYELTMILRDGTPNDPLTGKTAPVARPAPLRARWMLAPAGAIRWDVLPEDLPHHDHIEMSGEQMSAVLRWGVNERQAFSLERSLVFPMLRTVPDNTHASLMHRVGLDITSLITVNGMCLQQEQVESVEIDGGLRVTGVFSVGKKNIGTGKGTAPKPSVRVVREIIPSTDKPVLMERYTVIALKGGLTVSAPKIDMQYLIPDGARTGEPKQYVVAVQADPCTVRIPDAGGEAAYTVSFQGLRAGDPLLRADFAEELAKRDGFVRDVTENLVLETMDPVLDGMFRHAKIRAAESIYRTAGGLMHGPGGESYYAAIWANDQAEYVNPLFPWLGNANGNESALNSFRHFARFMNDAYKPIPSSIIAEGRDIWNGAGDRGDAAMIAYGASRYALALGDRTVAEELWPLITWCLEYCRRQLTRDGVVASDTDELEGRFPAGDANLCTSSLYYDALVSADLLSRAIGKSPANYARRAQTLRKAIEKHFGSEMKGFHTYRYYAGNDLLRSWICIPLCMGIYDRAEGTADALLSPALWSDDGCLTQEGSRTYWDRSTLYAFRGLLAAGQTERVLPYLHYYSQRRLLGDHVPYAIEAWPEGSQRHLSAESGLFCRVITEGLFGIRPTGLDSFDLTPRLPDGWPGMNLRHVRAFGRDFDITVQRTNDCRLVVTVGSKTYVIRPGSTIHAKL